MNKKEEVVRLPIHNQPDKGYSKLPEGSFQSEDLGEDKEEVRDGSSRQLLSIAPPPLQKQLTRTKVREAFVVEALKFENHEHSMVFTSTFEEHSSFDDDDDDDEQYSPQLVSSLPFGQVAKPHDESQSMREQSYEEVSDSEKRGRRDLDFPPIVEVEETQELQNSLEAEESPIKLNSETVKDEQDRVLQQRQMASFVKLRTEIFKVTTSQSSTDKIQSADTSQSKRERRQDPLIINFGFSSDLPKPNFDGNRVRTQRYTAFSFAPLSLLYQFKRVSNIYFLIISILTFMPFSPKNPVTMISTFVLVLVFTMIKEAYEDYQRYKLDKEMNNKLAEVLEVGPQLNSEPRWSVKKWMYLAPGDIVRLKQDFEVPADLMILQSANKNGVVYVDTMNWDGETNLKEKYATNKTFTNEQLSHIKGEIMCEAPNENLDRWEAQLNYDSEAIKNLPVDIKNMILRGCIVRNTEFAICIVVYVGNDTKIMKNLKKSPHKVSNMMRQMNKMLYSVFLFQFVLISLFAGLYLNWNTTNSQEHFYLFIAQNDSQGESFFVQLLVFWVAYSHMIPISLYVIIEILKLGQALYINKDIFMYDRDSKSYANAANSDLIEELGQVEMVFSDKTGTLTQNKMVLKKCQINGQQYGNLKPNEQDNLDGISLSGLIEIKEKIKEEKQLLHRLGTSSSSPSINVSNMPYVTYYFMNLALCNSVIVEAKISEDTNKKEYSYKAASPDELALVIGAKSAGIELQSREHKVIKIYNKVTREHLSFKIIAEFPFDSMRKRMSVLVKDLQSGNYRLMCKGADSVMLDRLTYEQNGIESLKNWINDDLNLYSCEGLRTLIFAQRSVCEEEYRSFKRIYRSLQQSLGAHKESKLLALFDQMEQQLRYLGCSAIEDKLQEGVAVTIEKMIQADIRFFMLTGDKLETAIEIAKSCQIIQTSMKVVILKRNRDELIKRLSSIVEKKVIDINEKVESLKNVEQYPIVLALEGSTLSLIIEDEELQNLFFHIAIRSKSVVCCRMSPKQKADVVHIFKKRGRWITLAIGDGSNDVSMIMEAHIGVGIKGKEGTQAARSSDFAISQFQFLLRLLLYQGRYGYTRVSSMICYYFYKNIVLVLTELHFAFRNGFSGQIFFLDWLPMLYNVLFTSFTCLFTLLLEKDVNYHYTYKYPQIYKVGQLRLYFNYQVFWKWIIFGVYHGLVCYYLPIYSGQVSTAEDGKRDEHWVLSTISFTIIVYLVSLKLLIENRHWNWISIGITIISLVIYFCVLFLSWAPQIVDSTQPQLVGIAEQILIAGKYWCLFLAGPLACLVFDFFIYCVRMVFFPTPIDKVLYEQVYVNPLYDHREQLIKLQKTQHRKKLQQSVNSETRKIEILQQRKSSFSQTELLRQQTTMQKQSTFAMNKNSMSKPSSSDIRLDGSTPLNTLGQRKQTLSSQKGGAVPSTSSKNIKSQSSQLPNNIASSSEQSPFPPKLRQQEQDKTKDQSLSHRAQVKEEAPRTQKSKKLVHLSNLELLNKINPQQPDAKQKGPAAESIEEDKYIEYFEDLSKPQEKEEQIESASSFSGNQDDPQELKTAPQQESQLAESVIKDILKTIKSANDLIKQREASPQSANEVPNNIQEDTIPDVQTINGKQLTNNPQRKQDARQDQKTKVNIEHLTKFCGNRTSNFFLLSNNNQIPKNKVPSAHDIVDTQMPQEEEQTRVPQETSEVVPHPLESGFLPVRKRQAKKYVQKYRNMKPDDV